MRIDIEDEEGNLPDWKSPPPSLWRIDIAAQETTRLTPKGLFTWKGCWLNGGKILFVSQSAKEKEPSIYEMTPAEKAGN